MRIIKYFLIFVCLFVANSTLADYLVCTNDMHEIGAETTGKGMTSQDFSGEAVITKTAIKNVETGSICFGCKGEFNANAHTRHNITKLKIKKIPLTNKYKYSYEYFYNGNLLHQSSRTVSIKKGETVKIKLDDQVLSVRDSKDQILKQECSITNE
jgi:hypothetical protein